MIFFSITVVWGTIRFSRSPKVTSIFSSLLQKPKINLHGWQVSFSELETHMNHKTKRNATSTLANKFMLSPRFYPDLFTSAKVIVSVRFVCKRDCAKPICMKLGCSMSQGRTVLSHRIHKCVFPFYMEILHLLHCTQRCHIS